MRTKRTLSSDVMAGIDYPLIYDQSSAGCSFLMRFIESRCNKNTLYFETGKRKPASWACVMTIPQTLLVGRYPKPFLSIPHWNWQRILWMLSAAQH